MILGDDLKKMEFNPMAWQRYEFEGTPIHIRDCLPDWFVPNERGDRIIGDLKAVQERAEQLGVGIDNLDAIQTQVFAPSGTIHDGTTGGWESAAIGPDDRLYPSPARIELVRDKGAGRHRPARGSCKTQKRSWTRSSYGHIIAKFRRTGSQSCIEI